MYNGEYHRDNYTTRFESLPSADMLQLDEERVKEIAEYANTILGYHVRVAESHFPFRVGSAVGLKERYHIASDCSAKINRNLLTIGPIGMQFTINNDTEAALLAMLICDSDCQYFDTYEAKRKAGLSQEDTMNYLQLYFGIRSPKLIQLERYYKLLNYRFAKRKVVVLNIDVDDQPPKR